MSTNMKTFATVSTRRRISKTAKYVALTLLAIPWIILPLWILIVNSFKPLLEATDLSIGLPKTWAIVENYSTVIEKGNYGTALRNSLTVTLPTILIVLFLGSVAAWAYARSKSMALKVAYYITSLSILLPPALLPTIFELKLVHLDGTQLGYILVTIGTRVGAVVFLVTGFIRTVPLDLEDAAAIDGASKAQTYLHVMLPLIAPVLFVASVILMISVWNEFFFASFLMPQSDLATLPLALFRFSATGTQYAGSNWNLIFAHVVMTSLPILIVYLFAQKRVISGLTEGGVKG